MATKSGKYVINNELTEDAHMTAELIDKCTFNVGSTVPVNIREEQNKKSNAPVKQYYQKFMDIVYPNGDKSASLIIPGCVMHHTIQDYYGKPSIYVGVPKNSFVRKLELQLSKEGFQPKFEDKKILSDSKYWWTRASFLEAEEEKEYIRIVEDDGQEAMYPSFAELFAEYPSSLLTNITCTVKFKTETDAGQSLTGKEEWRAGLQISMFTPYDTIDVPAPSTGIAQRSIAGAKDRMKGGLLELKKKRANGN